MSGFFTVGDNPQATFRRTNYTLGDDLHVLIGTHSLTFGFHGEDAKVDVNNLFQQPGLFTFNANVTNNASAAARPTRPASPRTPSGMSCEWGWRTGKLSGGAAAWRASGMLPGPMPKAGSSDQAASVSRHR